MKMYRRHANLCACKSKMFSPTNFHTKYSSWYEQVLRLFLTVRVKSAIVFYRMIECGVTDEGCAALASALRSNSSQVRELYLSSNKLQHTGLKLLSAGLKGPHCKLKKLM